MTPWKLPPKEKVYEAFSVLADNRYEFVNNNQVKVTSSAGDKHYTVKWHDDGATKGILVSSNDNASHWQGYTGYPIIAILMILDKIHYDKTILTTFAGIPWNNLNKSHKNDYAKVVEIILSDIEQKDRLQIIKQVDLIYEQLSALKLFKLTR